MTPSQVAHLCDIATMREPFDVVLVLILVKAHDTRSAVELIRPFIAKDDAVVGQQNGMSIEEIAETAGADRAPGRRDRAGFEHVPTRRRDSGHSPEKIVVCRRWPHPTRAITR
ncbi:ketopantoate reductase family protein [Cryobacterium psychrophilum]|uniref:ketopantoate reductase family protein n=1 Tax=Cryobacterium psychrophilum TaxID=41988 RepID=UPI001FBB4889|nr:2-dehydropantoate 2-reductase N-terminal domain-containing protein [Cryobacterium psychrophilum]